jgi:hypothetical protein
VEGQLLHLLLLAPLPAIGARQQLSATSAGHLYRCVNPAVNDTTFNHRFVHVVLDDHSPAPYVEIHDYKTSTTTAAVLRRAVDWFTAHRVRPVRALADIQA